MKISKKYLKYLCCLMPFLLSSIVYTQISDSFANILLLFKMGAFFYIAWEYIRGNGLSKLDVAIGAYFFVWFVSVLLNGSSMITYIKEVVVILSYVFLFESAFNKTEDSYLILAFEHILFLELTANLFCLIFIPEGLWTTYSIYGQKATYSFLGLDNQVTPILIVAELILLIRIQYDNHRITPFSFLFAAVLVGNFFFTMSATGIIGGIIVPFVTWLGYKNQRFINVKVVICVVISAFLLIVVFRKLSVFSFLIEGVLNKDLTLSNRIGIWDRAIDMIKEKPILGYGCGTLDTVIYDRNAHDYYLQLMLQSGLIGIVAYTNIFFVGLKKCWINKSYDSSIFVSAALCGYMICCISEVYSQSWLLIILALGYNVGLIPRRATQMHTQVNQELTACGR